MDFDDLEEEAEKRLADGEEVEGYVRTNNQAPTGTVLPEIAHSERLPSETHLPEKAQATLTGEVPDRSSSRKIYLLACYGAGDACMSGWIQMAREAPAQVEMAIYEWPGHGVREEEPFQTSVEAAAQDIFLTFRAAMDAGPFALIGHSIGVTLCMAVAHIAKRELGVEPLLFFALERGPPCYGVLNDIGVELLRGDIKAFMDLYTPQLARMIQNIDSPDCAPNIKRVAKMWQNDLEFEQSDMDSPMRRHVFNCDIHVFVAMKDLADVAEKDLSDRAAIGRIKRSEDAWNFSRETFNDWSQWTTKKATIHEYDDTHFRIKSREDVKRVIWTALETLVSSWDIHGRR